MVPGPLAVVRMDCTGLEWGAVGGLEDGEEECMALPEGSFRYGYSSLESTPLSMSSTTSCITPNNSFSQIP